MKPRVVQVDVKNPRPERTVGDAPGIGRVARVSDLEPRTEPHRARRVKRQESNSEESSSDWLSRISLIASCALALAVIAGLLYAWGRKDPDAEVSSPSPDSRPMADLGDGQIRPPVSLAEMPDPEVMQDLVRRGVATRYPGRVAEYFRFAQEIDRMEVIAFLDAMEERDGLVSRYQVLDPVQANGRWVGLVAVDSQADGNSRRRLAMLVADDEGQWKIDFEAFSRRVTPSWQQLLERGAVDGMVRVTVRPDSVSEGGAGDDWDRYRIDSGDPGVQLLGHCRRGSVAARALAAQEFPADSALRMTLMIRPLAGGERNHFEITRVLAQDWVVFEPAYDEQFQ